MRQARSLLQWHHRRPHAWLLSLALGMLVLMQSLGGAHAVLHHREAAARPAAGAPSTPFDQHSTHSADCQLFDQLAHADLAWLPLLHWAEPSAAAPVFLPADTSSAARQPQLFRSRGPPAFA